MPLSREANGQIGPWLLPIDPGTGVRLGQTRVFVTTGWWLPVLPAQDSNTRAIVCWISSAAWRGSGAFLMGRPTTI